MQHSSNSHVYLQTGQGEGHMLACFDQSQSMIQQSCLKLSWWKSTTFEENFIFAIDFLQIKTTLHQSEQKYIFDGHLGCHVIWY